MPQLSTSHVFMSYSRRDEIVMRRVVAFLRKQGINVWLDNERLVPGTPIWEAEIENAIFSAGAVVVLLSPDSKNSPWVRREISYAEDNDKRIFPVFVAGNPRDTIPIRLTNHQRIDIRENEEAGLNFLAMTLSFYLDDLHAQEKKGLEEVEKLSRAEEKRLADEAEKERQAKAEAKRLADEKAEAERLASQKVEEERLTKAKLEAERLAEEKHRADEKAKEERKAREEAERFAAQKAEEQRVAKAKMEAEQLAAQKVDEERLTKAKGDGERLAEEKRRVDEKAKANQVAAQKADEERIVKAKLVTEHRANEREEAERKVEEKTQQITTSKVVVVDSPLKEGLAQIPLAIYLITVGLSSFISIPSVLIAIITLLSCVFIIVRRKILANRFFIYGLSVYLILISLSSYIPILYSLISIIAILVGGFLLWSIFPSRNSKYHFTPYASIIFGLLQFLSALGWFGVYLPLSYIWLPVLGFIITFLILKGK